MSDNDSEVLFAETQRPRQWWLWVLLLSVGTIGWGGFLEQIVEGGQFGSDPASDTTVILIWLSSGVLLPAVFWFARLETRVRPGTASVQFPPFRARTVDLNEVLEVAAVDYRPVAHYGGYGYRIKKGGVAFNVSGKRGVKLTLPKDRHLLIGSQRADELAAAIQRAQVAS